MKYSLLFLVPLVVLGGCSSVPDATIMYYKSSPNVTATLTQLLTCDQDQDEIFQSARLTTTVTHSAGAAAGTTIDLKEFNGTFRNGNMSFMFYPDGRLNTINANVTGTGEATINSVASVVGSIFGLNFGGFGIVPAAVPAEDTTAPEVTAVCKAINDGNDKKNAVMTLVYNKTLQGESLLGTGVSLDATSTTEVNLAKIRKNLELIDKNKSELINSVSVSFKKDGEPYSPISNANTVAFGAKRGEFVQLDVQKIQKYNVDAVRTFNADLGLQIQEKTIPSSSIIVASDTVQSVAIPKGGAFGTSNFSMTLSELGSITSIGYNSTRGTSSALDSINTGLSELQQRTDQEVANSIAQQARRLRCEAEPAACT